MRNSPEILEPAGSAGAVVGLDEPTPSSAPGTREAAPGPPRVSGDPADTRFQRLSRLAASLLEAPDAFVSLVDEHARLFSGARALTASLRQRSDQPISDTLCQHVARAGSALVIPDTATHPVTLARPSLVREHVGAYVGVPILDPETGEILGTLCVIDRRPRPWSEAQVATLEEIAAAAASEIRVRAVASRIEELHREQRFLAEVGAAAAASLNLVRLAEVVARLALQHFADAVALSLSAAGVATVAAQPEDRAGPLGRILEACGGPLEGAACVLLDARGGDAVPSAASELGAHTALVVPIGLGGLGAGALLLVGSDPARAYSEVDVQLAEEVARIVGLAVENARLFAEARAAVQARDDMLSVVSHDLRNPLGVIGMATQLLDTDADRLSQAQRSRYLAMIRRAADSAVVLVNDLLEAARLEAGSFALDRRGIDIAALIGEVRETQQPLADRAGVRLDCSAPTETFSAWADRERLLRVFANLVGNALKFTPAGGSVTVGAAAEDAGVRFFVRDTGAGIASEDLSHLFTRFWQANAADERGAGLGLSIVKAIVEAHDGRVWAESRLGEGTTIHFWLPSADGAAAEDRSM